MIKMPLLIGDIFRGVGHVVQPLLRLLRLWGMWFRAGDTYLNSPGYIQVHIVIKPGRQKGYCVVTKVHSCSAYRPGRRPGFSAAIKLPRPASDRLRARVQREIGVTV
jgi:hypothetical protein